MSVDQPVGVLKGVGAVVGQHLSRLGITTVGDLLEHFPRRYEDRSQLRTIREIVAGQVATFAAVVERAEVQRVRGKSLARVWVSGRHWSGCAGLVQSAIPGKKLEKRHAADYLRQGGEIS